MTIASEAADQDYDMVSSDLSLVNIQASGISLFLLLPLFTPQLFLSSVCGGPQLRELLPLIYPECIFGVF